MGKIYVLAAVAMSMVACAGTPWLVTASSDRSAVADRPAPSERAAPPGGSVMLGEQDVDRPERDGGRADPVPTHLPRSNR